MNIIPTGCQYVAIGETDYIVEAINLRSIGTMKIQVSGDKPIPANHAIASIIFRDGILKNFLITDTCRMEDGRAEIAVVEQIR